MCCLGCLYRLPWLPSLLWRLCSLSCPGGIGCLSYQGAMVALAAFSNMTTYSAIDILADIDALAFFPASFCFNFSFK
jgi:hypothetical protein